MPHKIYKLFLKLFEEAKSNIERFKKLALRNRRANIEKKIILNLFKKRQFPRLSQFKYIFRFLTKVERNALIVFIAFTFIAFIGLSSIIYNNATMLVASRGGEYIEGIVGYPRFANPLYSKNNDVDEDLTALFYSGLTKRNLRGAIVMDLAEDYKVSEDEKNYTFSLKKDVYWHDGKKFNADDVVFTINAIKEKNYNSPLLTSWEGVDVERIDEYTVKFQLKKPYGAFLTLTTVGIMPKHVWEKVPIANINLAEANNKPIGTGPYKFKSFTKDKVGVIKEYELEQFKDFYDKRPAISKLVLKFYPDYISAINALDNRQIDGLAFAGAEVVKNLRLKSRIKQHDILLPQFNAIFLNSKKNSVLESKSIRRALAEAIDREKILEDAIEGEGFLIDGPILAGYLGYDDKISKTVYDKSGAEKLLAESGWVLKDGNKIREKSGKNLKITLTTIEKGQNIKAAGIIKENWESIGVQVELKIISAANMTEDILRTRNYEALLFGAMYGPDLDPYSYWHSSARTYPGLNLAGYSNREVDSLLEQARKSSDKVVKQKKYQEVQSLLIEDFPTIFLWQPKYSYLIDKKVKGVQFTALITPSDRFNNIIQGYINTKRALR